MAEQPGKGKGKERLLGAAKNLAQTRPFDEITIDEIVKAASLSRPAFYYHFAGGKEELRRELIQNGIISAAPLSDTRQTILDAALHIFAYVGVSAATLDDIALEAGVSRSTLSWHFHSKDDLLKAIINQQDFYIQLRTAIEKITDEARNSILSDDAEILHHVADAFYDFFTGQQNLTRLSVLLTHTHPEAAHLIAEKITRARQGINNYIEARQKEGIFRADIDPALFVHLLAMTFVMLAVGRGLNDLLLFAHLSREAVINQLVSLLLYGIKTNTSTQKEAVET